jgi:hypothetical protein
MAEVRVYGETPEEEFEEVAERAYKKVPRELIDSAETETALSNVLINKYFYNRGYAKLMPGIVKAFKKKGWWEEPQIVMPMAPEEVKAERVVQEKPLVLEEGKQAKVTRPKVIKIKLSKASSDEEIERYVDSRPSRAKRGKIYKVSRNKKSVRKDVYIKRLKNLVKGWNKQRTKKTI